MSVKCRANTEYSDNSWKLMSVANHNELGSKERVLEKIEKIKKYAREARQISSDDGAAGSKVRNPLQQKTHRATVNTLLCPQQYQ